MGKLKEQIFINLEIQRSKLGKFEYKNLHENNKNLIGQSKGENSTQIAPGYHQEKLSKLRSFRKILNFKKLTETLTFFPKTSKKEMNMNNGKKLIQYGKLKLLSSLDITFFNTTT